MNAALVSVLVPTYNGERFLGETLRSALAQTHQAIEVLVGDDSSTDGTAGLLRELAATDSRIRVLRHAPARGAWGNSLSLLTEARGEYVKFLYHDDLLEPDCVATLVGGLEHSRAVTLAFSHRSIIDEEGHAIEGASPLLLTTEGLLDGRQLGDTVLSSCRNIIGEPSTCLFRRSDVDPADLVELDGRPLVANEDVALWLRLLSRGKAYYTPRTLSSFRRHGLQQTANPRVLAGGALDWPRIIDWGRRQGFLAAADEERQAHVEALAMAAGTLSALPASEYTGEVLEAAFLSTSRLLELHTGDAAHGGRPLSERAHAPVALSRLSQQLDVWSRPHAVALAAPAPDPIEVAATIDALRQVRASGAAPHLVLAVAPRLVATVVPLAEAALAAGPDIDVDLVPTDDPAALLEDSWLAVAPRAGTWHRGRVPVWIVDLAAARTQPVAR
ncbi:glycosyltransferase [Geodermatophilus sp. DSM 45219]|uniref:glycosyltransferase family 2 protein n=1 Tax=Geodermatophilus sp. DSM 45219 TaxID=1881103 RepID=UPI00088C6B70|nr:glycosyltransferase [Geodermatophilus sp. DSM 45219]SDN43373.1 Glycosyl transferase family 2 [Geodermatophilus sp. DSM 45219]